VPWRLRALGAFALLAAGAIHAEEPPADDEAWARRVNPAIDEGVAWLKARQREDGSFPIGKAEQNLPVPLPGMDDPSANWAGGPWDKGADALAVYTLAACDVPREDPVLARGFQRIRAHWDGRRRDSSFTERGDGISTYFVSLCLLALDAACDRTAQPLNPTPEELKARKRAPLSPQDRAWAVELVEWLRLAQDPGGAPADPPPPEGKKKKPPRKKPPVSPAAPSRADGGGFGYESPILGGGYHDHSNTQFAALGLKAAARLGVDVREEVWSRLLRHMLAVQEAEGPEVPRVEVPAAPTPAITPGAGDGKTVAPPAKDRARGWGYMCPNSAGSGGGLPGGVVPGGVVPGGALPRSVEEATLSMTAGGVSTLIIARSELLGSRAFTGDIRPLAERGIRDGFAWIVRHLPSPGAKESAPEDPPLPMGFEIPFGDELDDFYFLYGLERACVLGGVQRLSGIDWYRLGAERILDRQRPDGSFLGKNQNNANGRPLIDSAFALLFLKRALFRLPDAAPVTTPSGPATPR
jgi:hypothetical protein